ncbi:hypothetical protein J4760_07375 [Salinicoccus sp. ID82-1]|uniref:DUF975 family protein n=1 Tax=Salinicoccus cyprini TaxID=2493691 RepID=A0A558ASQ1_9STAP|nr:MULTISPECIES: hypothetical protein [Salinicoccus]MCG1009839.1 hypothetical protein [Salinicoccus sp. ID82-1]TVT27295.1 hypothetical protein FO441_09635 [Salinicoccus cyprini]
MFQYQGAYKDNGRDLHMKTFWSSVLVFILIYAACILLGLLMIVPFFVLDTGLAVLPAIALFLLLILTAIFVFYPLAVGIMRYFAAAYRGRNFRFKDVFKVFSKGNYSKVIKMGLLTLIGYFIFSFAVGMIVQVLTMAVNAPLLAVFDPSNMESTSTGGQTGSVVAVIVLNLLVVLLSYIPYVLVTIYMFLVYMAYIDEPLTPTTEKFQMAWDVMFRSGESVMKLIFSNLILWVVPIIVYALFIIAAVLLGGFFAETAFIVLLSAGVLFMLIAYLIVMYFMVGSITAYYFKGRDRLDQQHQAQPQV